MTKDEIMELVEDYVSKLVDERMDDCTGAPEEVMGRLHAVVEARAALEAALASPCDALTEKQEPVSATQIPLTDDQRKALSVDRHVVIGAAPEAKQEPVAVKAGEVAIGVLCERKGFDDWWDGIDADLQQEILAEIDAAHTAPVAEQEPVAWRLYKGGELYALKHEKEDRGEFYTWEPLYLHPAPVNQEPVAWRYVPSEVWGSHVVTDDPEKAKLASEHGITVKPLYTHPAPVNQQLLEALKLVSVMLKTGSPEYDERDAIEVIDAAIAAAEKEK